MDANALPKTYDSRDVEAKWYEFWLKNRYFHAQDVSDKKPFCIVIPPPNVTGMLHMGHALNNTLQDIMTRYRRMQGYNALWMPGTDHAGIATQNVVEQELAKQGKTRHDLGREKFIERVWQWKEKYGGVILHQLQRLGCSCDWERERFTMDEGLSRAVREVFVRLWHDGLIYKGDYIVNWCPRCHTAISDLEVEFEQEKSNLWHIRYPFADGTGEISVATTRPETMLGDTAVAVNPNDPRYKDVIGKMVILPLVNKEIPIIADDYVTMDFGSGAVKITPACDAADFAIAGRHNLEIIKIMDGSAVINENGGAYKGQDRYEARRNIVKDLEKGGYLIRIEDYTHNIGRCYRCKTDVEPAVSAQYFVKVAPLAKEAIAAVVKGDTKLIPSMWDATYFEWMNNIRDWCISRQIWWGHRIPLWTCEGCGEVIVQTDDPTQCPKCEGRKLQQEEDVLDTWFSSALWPFTTLGWPDDKPALKTFYPTSLLITGFDILFFWVARMMMMGLYIMKDVPFKDVYLHALVRDVHGEKMSKSKGNIIDPLEMIDKFGADAFRFTLAAFTAQGRDIRMSEQRIEGYKHFVNKIWNAARLCMMNLEGYPDGPVTPGREDYSLADRWIRARLNDTIADVTQGLDEYRFNDAAGAAYAFIWHELCDWYLELVKPVLYGKENEEARKATQRTLYAVLKSSLKLLHPFMPFMTEEIWGTLVADGSAVMTSSFPSPGEFPRDKDAESRMALIVDVITAVRNIRGEMAIAPSRKLKVLLSADKESDRAILQEGGGYIVNLANLEELAVRGNVPEPKKAATGLCGTTKVYVLLEGVIDFAAERTRLEKEMAKVDKDLAVVDRKLSNPDFRTKAAPAILEKEERKSRDFQEKRKVLQAALRRLEEMAE